MLNIEAKKTIYESFVRCHLLYGLTIWGGAKKQILLPLEKTLSRIWRKIGPHKMHTLNRLQKFSILKLEDELLIQESKFLWKWHNKKLPRSLNTIIEEKNDRLRGRRFIIPRNVRENSTRLRLAKRANTSITSISSATSKNMLVRNLKNATLEKYQFSCERRHCYICSRT